MFRNLYDNSVFAVFYDNGAQVTVLNDSGCRCPWSFRLRMAWGALESFLEDSFQ